MDWNSIGHESITYNQVANQDLEDLGLQAGAASEDLLQDSDEDVAEGRGDEHAVQRHLGDARREVVAMLADIVGQVGGEEFLETREHTRGEHLGAQRVVLELLEVGLQTFLGSVWNVGGGGFIDCMEWFEPMHLSIGRASYREVAGSSVSTGQSLTNAVHQVLWLAASDGADGLLLKLDRHGGLKTDPNTPKIGKKININ